MRTSFILLILILSACSPYIKFSCPQGPALVPRNNPKKNYPNYVKSGSAKVGATLKIIGQIDTAAVSVDTRRNITMLRDTLNSSQYLIDKTLFEAKKLSDQNPCNEELKKRYFEMCENIQRALLNIDDTKIKELNKISSSSNFGNLDENKLNNLIFSLLGKNRTN